MKSMYSTDIVKKMFLYLLPAQIIATMTTSLSGIINGLLVGNFMDPLAMVALGFVTPLTSFIAAISGIIAGGSRIVCGRHIGKGQSEKISNTFSYAITTMIVIGVIISLITFFYPTQVAILLGSTGETTIPTASYIKGMSIGYLPTLLVPVLMIFLQMVNAGNFSMTATIILVVFNLIFSLINIFVLDASVFGMAVSTTLSQYVALICIVVYIRSHTKLLKYKPTIFSLSEVGSIIILGSPNALACFLYSFRNIIINSEALKLGGTTAVAALAILNTSCAPLDAVNIGSGNVSSILASVFAGERDKGSLENLFKVSKWIGLAMAMVKCCFLAFFGTWFVKLFGAQGEVIHEARMLAFWYGVCMPINIITLSFMSQLQSLGRILYSNVIQFINAIVVPLGMIFLLGPIFGTKVIWVSYSVAEIVTIGLFYLYPMLKYRRLKVCFSEIMGYETVNCPDKKMYVTVDNHQQAVNISEKFIKFLIDSGVDGRRARLCGLSIEEIACNIALRNEKLVADKKLSINIFAGCNDDGSIYILFKDTGVPFTINEQFKVYDPEDPLKNIGIRMVYQMATDINYRDCFGLNVLSYQIN